MRHARPAPPPRWGAWLADWALTAAAAGGAVCMLLVVLAAVFDVSLIMFKTNSMAPTIPAGSVAVVREVPAADIAVGDIVTVDRPGGLPVTHRVTSVAPADGPGRRNITLRGDANAFDDAAPYTVSTVRTVLGSVPGLARVVVWFGDPYVLGPLTLGAAGLVTWAFWPRGDEDDGGAPALGLRAADEAARSPRALSVAGLCAMLAAAPSGVPAETDAAWTDAQHAAAAVASLQLPGVGALRCQAGTTSATVSWDDVAAALPAHASARYRVSIAKDGGTPATQAPQATTSTTLTANVLDALLGLGGTAGTYTVEVRTVTLTPAGELEWVSPLASSTRVQYEPPHVIVGGHFTCL